MKNFTRYLLSVSLYLTLLGGFSFQVIATANSLETIQLIAHEAEVDSPDNGSVSFLQGAVSYNLFLTIEEQLN